MSIPKRGKLNSVTLQQEQEGDPDSGGRTRCHNTLGSYLIVRNWKAVAHDWSHLMKAPWEGIGPYWAEDPQKKS